MRFFCVNHYVPEETIRLLRKACGERGIDFVEIHAPAFSPGAGPEPAAGDLLYRPAVSTVASRVEQTLARRDVATFYGSYEAFFFECLLAPLYHQRSGLPIPETIFTASTDRAALRSQVERLGGFPVVAKVLGYSGGLGVVRIDSFPALFSFMDFADQKGSLPLLCECVPDAVHWRLIVLGDRILTSYRNVADEDDFRTSASDRPEDYGREPSREMAEIAIRAVATLNLEFGGVDLLESPRGLYLLEANFPCYFAHPQEVAGIDVAGPMVDYLVAKSERLAPRRPPARPSSSAARPPAPARRYPQRRVESLATSPRLFLAASFASEKEVGHVLDIAQDIEALRRRGIEVHRDWTGLSFEMPVAGDPVLEELRLRIHDLAGIENDLGETFRFRRYQPGEEHPLHIDNYEIGGLSLVATALLYLTDVEEGGETHFPCAEPTPVKVAPRRGALALWFNHHRDGAADESSVHEALTLRKGEKCTLATFFYKPLTVLRTVQRLA